MMKTEKIFMLLIIALILILAVDHQAGATPNSLPVVKKVEVAVTTSGATGSATGSAATDVVIQGRILRVDVDYGSITTTTDLTIVQTNELQAVNIVNRANTATDAIVYPTIQLTDNTGTGRTYDGTRPVVDYIPVADTLTVSLAQTTAATPAVTVDIYYEER